MYRMRVSFSLLSRAAIVGALAAALTVAVTGAAANAAGEPTVRSGSTALRVRSGPGTQYARIGALPNGAVLSVACQADGQPIGGIVRSTSLWDRLPSGGYVSHAYVDGDVTTRSCDSVDQFIAGIADAARADRATYGVPASITIAQAILETGWGESELARVHHNYFGITCYNTDRPSTANGCVETTATECAPDGTCAPATVRFRTYATVADSLHDHSALLSQATRYATAMTHAADPDRFARDLKAGGYATDPVYAEKLIALMQRHNLYRFDA
jgi:flagellar protein FlgJ